VKVWDAINHVSEAPLAPVYILVGSSDYWIETWMRTLIHRAEKDYGEVEVSRLGRSGALEWNRLLEAWQTPNLWGNAQIFWVENLTASAPARIAPEWFQPTAGRHLVVCETKRGPASRLFTHAVGVEVESPPANWWKRWIALRAKSRGINLAEDGHDVLALLIPKDGHHLEQELNKMELLRGEVDRWNGPLIRSWILPELGEESIWAVTDALLAKDGRALNGALKNALAQGKAPVMLLALMARQLSSIRRAKRASSETAFQASESLPPFVSRKIYREAKKWQEAEVVQAIGWAAELDRWFKDSLGEPGVSLVQFALLLVSG